MYFLMHQQMKKLHHNRKEISDWTVMKFIKIARRSFENISNEMMQQHSLLFVKIVEQESRGIYRERANKKRIST